MKVTALLVSTQLLLAGIVSAQCEYCSNLNLALKHPEVVVELDLRARGMRTVPLDLNKFSNLKTLILSDNFILELPLDSLRLPNLEELIISNNPGFFAFDLQGINQAFPSLQYLNLSDNGIAWVSAEVARLPHLSHLDLSHNDLIFLPEELDAMAQLKSLDVSFNRLKSQDYLFANLWNIEELQVAGNQKITAAQLSNALCFKDSLRYLSVSINSGEVLFDKRLNDLPLKVLHITDSDIRTLSSSLANNRQIKKLIVERCTIQNAKSFFSIAGRMDSLETLEFRDMELPSDMGDLAGIKTLALSGTTLPAEAVKNLSPRVRIIALDGSVVPTGQIAIDTGNEWKQDTFFTSEMLANDTPCLVDVKRNEQVIDPATPTVLELPNSAYEIPANAFLDAQGKVYTGAVTVRVKEYTDALENALAGAPMIYNGNGNPELFSSSGMIDFRAYAEDGSPLNPNPENPVIVELRDLQPRQETNLYVYDSVRSDWQAVGVPQSSAMDSILQAEIARINAMSDEEIVSYRRIYPLVLPDIKISRRDLTTIQFETMENKKSKSRPNAGSYNMSAFGQHELTSHIWSLDVQMTDSMRALLLEIREGQRRTLKYARNKRKRMELELPRLVGDIRLVPDFEHDVYRLQFTFKGKEMDFPVYEESARKPGRVQENERKFYDRYVKLDKEDAKEEAKVTAIKNKFVEEQANVLRQQWIEATTNAFSRNDRFTVDTYRFGLNLFGLVNCDYFKRVAPDYIVRLDSVGVDQYGNDVEVPLMVRNVMTQENVYMSVVRTKIPMMNGTNYLVYNLADNEIGVIKSTKIPRGILPKLIKPDVVRINIEGLTPEEVKEQILGS